MPFPGQPQRGVSGGVQKTGNKRLQVQRTFKLKHKLAETEFVSE